MKSQKLHIIGLLAAAALSLLAFPVSASGGGGGGGGGGPCSGFSEGSRLVMRDNCFDGVAQFSPSNSTLVVTNSGVIPHTYTAADGSFDTGTLLPGESAEIKLGGDGLVRVWCTIHGTPHGTGMAGVLLVGSSLQAGKVAQLSSPGEFPISAQVESSTSPDMLSQLEDALARNSRTSLLAIAITGGILAVLVIIVNRRPRLPAQMRENVSEAMNPN